MKLISNVWWILNELIIENVLYIDLEGIVIYIQMLIIRIIALPDCGVWVI